MNKLIALCIATGLGLIANGCASYPGYDSPYYSGYSGYSQPHHHEKERQSSLQEKQVQSLQDAAKKGADPSSTLYQQMLLQQMH